MSHIFLSYSREDADEAKQLVDGLRSSGFVVWQDITALKGGEIWRTGIRRGVQECVVFLLLWSPNSQNSEEVGKEIDLAKEFAKPILPLCLNTEPSSLPEALSGRNALRWSDGLGALIPSLPATIRRRRAGFDPRLPMRDQAEARSFRVGDIELVSAPLIFSSQCQAHVVARPEQRTVETPHLQLCLQLSRRQGDGFVSDVFRYINGLDEENQMPFVCLVVTGPKKFDGTHWLDNKNPVHWIDALDTTRESVEDMGQNLKPALHVFSLAPAVLTFAMGTQLYRFYRFYLYNYVDDRDRQPDDPAYHRVLVM